jgi:TolB-like protein
MWSVLLLSLAAQNAGASELKDGDPSKLRLAIMAIAPEGVPPEYAAGITETIATDIARTGVFDTISPRQIGSILAYEKRKDALGACLDDACFAQVARLVKAEHLIGGSVAKVGSTLVLNLILIDAAEGRAQNRSKRETDNPSELIAGASRSAIVLLKPLLSKRMGYLKVATNVPDAAVLVDDERRSEGVGQVIALPAGPHTVKVSKDGFYPANADVLVQPGAVLTERVSLIPAKETIAAYESKADFMRTAGWISGALAVGAGVASVIFYSQASDDKQVVDAYAALSDFERAQRDRAVVTEAKDSFEVNQGLYLGALGGAILLGGASLYFWLAGDDPDRYEEFRALQ